MASSSGATTICEGGTNPGTACSFSDQCLNGGTCTGVTQVRIAARGVLTIIADTKPVGVGWTTTSISGCNPATSGAPGSCETKDNAILTLLLEFTLNGKKYTFAESFTRLPDGAASCPSDCDFVIGNWSIGLGSEAGWNEHPVESAISEHSMAGQPVQLRWGGLPPAAETAVGLVLGRTGNQRVGLSRVDDVPICTDTAACGASPKFSDHSGASDPLGTVRRYKVDIAVIGP
jgi:hypothetical protein